MMAEGRDSRGDFGDLFRSWWDDLRAVHREVCLADGLSEGQAGREWASGGSCEEAAEVAGVGESEAAACEDQRYGCPTCPFRREQRDSLRDGHRASCEAEGMMEDEIEADWEAFKRDYEEYLDGK